MFQINDYVVYNFSVCKIIDFKVFSNKKYYVLEPISDCSLKINVPVLNNNMRHLITRDRINELINEIPSIEVVCIDSKNIDSVYKGLISDGSYESLIKIIKTAFVINRDRVLHNKKARDKDEYYFAKAEELLYSEFSIVLNMSFEETKNYVVSEVKKLV